MVGRDFPRLRSRGSNGSGNGNALGWGYHLSASLPQGSRPVMSAPSHYTRVATSGDWGRPAGSVIVRSIGPNSHFCSCPMGYLWINAFGLKGLHERGAHESLMVHPWYLVVHLMSFQLGQGPVWLRTEMLALC